MKPKEFKEQNIVFAKGQPEYQPLPAFRDGTTEGNVISCWQLSEEEILKLIDTGELWVSVMTFNNGLQPMYLTVHKEEILITK